MNIAVIISVFNDFVTKKMFQESLRAFMDLGLTKENYEIFYVPGAFEIPALASKLIQTKKFDGILALGAVIRGETDHYDFICRGVSYGIQKVAIENAFPVVFGILTCQNETLAVERAQRGYEYGKNIVELVKLYQSL